jgi:hypothetical protein
MTLAKANKTFIVQALLTVITYNHQNIFIVQATDLVASLSICDIGLWQKMVSYKKIFEVSLKQGISTKGEGYYNSPPH